MADASRFFDATTGEVMRIELRQCGGSFKLLRAFGYRDPRYTEAFVVPANLEDFTTDLASIPWFFAWLVPGLGTHLPAVILHDGLVRAEGALPDHRGPDVSREEADHILRDAMACLGVPKIRRWIMWTAVIIATAWTAMRPTWRWRGLVAGTLATIIGLGVLATLDLFDVVDVLPWMGTAPWWRELLGGAAFAIVIPLLISCLWGRLWPAAAIAGVAIALLLHVTVAIAVLYGAYWVAEKLISRGEGTGPDVRQSFDDATERAPDTVTPATTPTPV